MGILVAFVAPNIYTIRKTPGIPTETVDAQLRAAAGLREFHLFALPGFGMDPTTFPIGNGYGTRYPLKTLDRSLSNMLSSSQWNLPGISSVDRVYKDRFYLRAPILFGSVDGGDIALDVTIPAPFGACRIVWSPVRQARANYNACQSLTNAGADQTINEDLRETSSFNSYAILGEFGLAVYEPVLIEKIPTTASVPSNYVSNPKRRTLGQVRAGQEATSLLNKTDNRPYGGGAWNPWIGGLIDLSTIPSSVAVTLVLVSSSVDIPSSSITVGWAIWNAASGNYVLTGATSNLTFIDSATAANYTARYSGTMPTPPTGNRQTQIRAQVVIPGYCSITGCGFNSFISSLNGYSGTFCLFTEARSARRRVWPWMINKNKIIGSDATVFEAENLGAIWTDPTPSPAVTYTSDWTLSWSSQKVLFSGLPIWSATNKATSTECSLLETDLRAAAYNNPSNIFYRVNIVGTKLYLQNNNSNTVVIFGDLPVWSVGALSFGAATIAGLYWTTVNLGQLPSGTVIQIEVKAVVNWTQYPNDQTNSRGNTPLASPATVFNKTYTMTVP